MEFRLPRLEDKEEIIKYITDHYAHSEKELSASMGLTSMKYEDWVELINLRTNIPDSTWLRSYTYLVFDNKRLVGLLSIRPEINEELANEYGHIGYGVKPSERRKGYASKMLEFALEECRKLGLKKVILGCYKDNIGSSKTIIKNGGKLIREVDDYHNVNDNYNINLIREYYEIEL